MHRPIAIFAALLAAAALAACGSSSGGSKTQTMSVPTSTGPGSTSGATRLGFEGVTLEQGPDVAPASSTNPGATVDGIQCGATEQLAYHIHAHLAVYAGGAPRSLPGGIGIPGSQPQQTQYGPIANGGSCIYWLHTHTDDGIIHVESPTQRIYTLGNFFDEWRQPLGPAQVGSARGKVYAFVNGKAWTADPRSIRLTPHAVIQLDVGSPTPPFIAVSWAGTQL
jgi:hypothetical protein